MLPVDRTPSADQDIDDILEYLAGHSADAASRLTDDLERRCSLLGQFPEKGRARDDIRAGLRSVSVQKYIVVYRVTETAVEILRVLHGSRDIGNIMRDE